MGQGYDRAEISAGRMSVVPCKASIASFALFRGQKPFLQMIWRGEIFQHLRESIVGQREIPFVVPECVIGIKCDRPTVGNHACPFHGGYESYIKRLTPESVSDLAQRD